MQSTDGDVVGEVVEEELGVAEAPAPGGVLTPATAASQVSVVVVVDLHLQQVG